MKKVIITGATGFIGSHCLDLLVKRNYDIHAISHKNVDHNDTYKGSVTWHELDLMTSDGLDDFVKKIEPNYLLHLAWKVETGLKLDSSENERWYKKSCDLINAFYKSGGERVLVTGSCLEYEMSSEIIKEDKTALNPTHEYGKSKDRLRRYLSEYAAKYDKSYAWGRIFFTYGPRQKIKSLLPYVISSLNNNEVVETTDGNQMYDYLYIKDVALALILLLEADYDGAVNICSGRKMRLKELILSVATFFNKEENIKFGSRPRPAGSLDMILGDNTRLKRVTNWKENFTLKEGIEQTINYYLKE